MRLSPGDILHVRLGYADLGDGQGPWVPSPTEILEARDDWEAVVPEGVKVIITHFGHEVTVLAHE